MRAELAEYAEGAYQQRDWDSYNSDPVSLDALRYADALWDKAARAPEWSAPTASGGVMLCWEAPRVRVEVEIQHDQRLGYLIVRNPNTPERESYEEHDAVSDSDVLDMLRASLT